MYLTIRARLELFRRTHELIRHKSTGTPKDLACRLDVSERTVFRIILHLRELGALIKWDRTHGSYVYLQDVDFAKLFDL